MQLTSGNAPTDLDLRAWLKDLAADGAISDEEMTNLEGVLGREKVLPRVQKAVMLNGDYTRKTQTLAEDRRTLEEQRKKLDDETAALVDWRKGVEGQLQKAYDDLSTARTTSAQYEARVKTIADRYGLDAAELLGASPPGGENGDQTMAHAQPAPSGFDPKQYLRQEDFDKTMEGAKALMPALSAELFDLNNEHQELFGKPLRDAKGLVNRALKAGCSLRELWEEEHKVGERRVELEVTKRVASEREKLEADYRAKVSEAVAAGGSVRELNQPRSTVYEKNKDWKPPAEADVPGKPQLAPERTAAQQNERWQNAALSFKDRRAQGIPLGQDAPSR
jgi:hypothetical protein